jgi:predicted permease
MEILNSLVPVFLVVLLGGVLRRTGFLTADLVRGTNRLCYWVALPALLFYEIARSPSSFTEHGKAATVMVLAIVVALGLGYVAARLLRQSPGTTATLVQASFRGNLAFIGLPILINAGGTGEARGAVSALLLGVGTLAANALAVVVLLLGQQSKFDRGALRLIGRQLATNPLIVACAAGALWSAAGAPLPVAVGSTLKALGQTASPLALLAIGATLQSTRLGRQGLRTVWVASLVKVLPVPLAAYVLARLAGLTPWETRAVVVYMACPAAAASYLLVEQIGGDRVVAAGAVVLSTVLSLVSLAAALALTTQ